MAEIDEPTNERLQTALEAAVVATFGNREHKARYLVKRGWEWVHRTGKYLFKAPDGAQLDLVTATVRQGIRDLERYRDLLNFLPEPPPLVRQAPSVMTPPPPPPPAPVEPPAVTPSPGLSPLAEQTPRPLPPVKSETDVIGAQQPQAGTAVEAATMPAAAAAATDAGVETNVGADTAVAADDTGDDLARIRRRNKKNQKKR